MRADKYLWAVRLFKTRTLAADACRGGKVSINKHSVKPSYEIKKGEIIEIRLGIITKTIRVKEILGNRVAAKLVPDYTEDLTPAEEYKKSEAKKDDCFVKRDRGAGRPSKKERRDINEFFPDW